MNQYRRTYISLKGSLPPFLLTFEGDSNSTSADLLLPEDEILPENESSLLVLLYLI